MSEKNRVSDPVGFIEEMSRTIGIDTSKFVVTAGCALTIMGHREFIRDIDILIDPDYTDELIRLVESKRIKISPRPRTYPANILDSNLKIVGRVQQQSYYFFYKGLEIDVGPDHLQHLGFRTFGKIRVHTLKSVMVFYRSIGRDVFDKLE